MGNVGFPFGKWGITLWEMGDFPPMYHRCTTIDVSLMYHQCTTDVLPMFHRCTSDVQPMYHRCITTDVPPISTYA